MTSISLQDSVVKQMADAESEGYTGVIYLYHRTTHQVIVQWAGLALSEETRSSIQQNLHFTFRDPDAASVYKSAYACESYYPKDLDIKLEPLSPRESSSRCVVEGDVQIHHMSSDTTDGNERVSDVISPIESVAESLAHSQARATPDPWQEQISSIHDPVIDALHSISPAVTPSSLSASLPSILHKTTELIPTNSLFPTQTDSLVVHNASASEEDKKRKKNESARESMRRLRERRRLERMKADNLKRPIETPKALASDPNNKYMPTQSYLTSSKQQVIASSLHRGRRSSQLNGAERMQLYIATEMEKQRLKRLSANAAASDCMRRLREKQKFDILFKTKKEEPSHMITQSRAAGNLTQSSKGNESTRERFTNVAERWPGVLQKQENQSLQQVTEKVNNGQPITVEEKQERERMKKNEIARESMRRLRERRRRQQLNQIQAFNPQMEIQKAHASRALLVNDQRLQPTTEASKERMKNNGRTHMNMEHKIEKWQESCRQSNAVTPNQSVMQEGGFTKETVKSWQVTSFQQNFSHQHVQKRTNKSNRAIMAEERRKKKNEIAREGMRRLRLRRRMNAIKQSQSGELKQVGETFTSHSVEDTVQHTQLLDVKKEETTTEQTSELNNDTLVLHERVDEAHATS